MKLQVFLVTAPGGSFRFRGATGVMSRGFHISNVQLALTSSLLHVFSNKVRGPVATDSSTCTCRRQQGNPWNYITAAAATQSIRRSGRWLPPHVDRSVDPRHQLRSCGTMRLGRNNKVGYRSRAFPDSNAQLLVDLIVHVGVGVNTTIGGIIVSWCIAGDLFSRCRLRAEVPLSGPVASNGRQRAELRGDWGPLSNLSPTLDTCTFHHHTSFTTPLSLFLPLSHSFGTIELDRAVVYLDVVGSRTARDTLSTRIRRSRPTTRPLQNTPLTPPRPAHHHYLRPHYPPSQVWRKPLGFKSACPPSTAPSAWPSGPSSPSPLKLSAAMPPSPSTSFPARRRWRA